MDYSTTVFFRREKTHLDIQDETDETASEPWVYLGETMMTQVPSVGTFLYLNGVYFEIVDQTWSIQLGTLSEPNFKDPQVMLTLYYSQPLKGGRSPTSDFFK
jgi:hypothetical protein